LKTVEKLLVALATAGVISMGVIANTTLLNGVRTGEIARRYDLPFTPAGWTFSIWSFIYLALLALTVYQAGRGAAASRVDAVRGPFVFAAVANMAWLLFWAYEALAATLALMLLLLLSLAAAYAALRASPPPSTLEAWCVDRPISLYLGWITAATLANLSVVVVSGGWLPSSLDPTGWSLVMTGVALAIAAFVYLRLTDPIYLAVLAWAMAGIAFKPEQVALVAMAAMSVAALAGVGAFTLLAGLGPRRA
jgi:translocator protein